MNRDAIPEGHPEQLRTYLEAMNLDDLIDLTEFATKVFSRGQSVYNHNLMNPNKKVQTIYVHDIEVMFQVIRDKAIGI